MPGRAIDRRAFFGQQSRLQRQPVILANTNHRLTLSNETGQ
jgi:hypothetical protein